MLLTDKERLEHSAYMYWCVARQYREAERVGDVKGQFEALEEIDTLASYTDWQQVLDRCNAMLPLLQQKKELVR